jgi:predicted nucleic acid-binding Zn ribbon protein
MAQMDTLTRADEQVKMATLTTTPVQAGAARMRDLTPAQRRAVMFAQQQVLRARAAKKAKDERQAALSRMWQEEDAESGKPRAAVHKYEAAVETKDVSLREAIGHVLRDLRTRDHKTLREVSEKAGVSLGYLSEVERGQKEASSELLSSIALSLGLSTAQMLRMVADYLDSVEG